MWQAIFLATIFAMTISVNKFLLPTINIVQAADEFSAAEDAADAAEIAKESKDENPSETKSVSDTSPSAEATPTPGPAAVMIDPKANKDSGSLTDIKIEPAQEDIFSSKTSINNPMNLRDPFKAPFLKKISEEQISSIKSSVRNGVFTNLPTADKITLDNIKVIGTLMGPEPRAIVATKESPKNSLLLKEGDKIGSNKVELKAVLPRGLVFVEQITNVYGQIEFLETVVAISAE